MRAEDIKAIAAIAVLYALLGLSGMGCPIKWATGISCAGCGMTRAWLCALRLDFASALAFHPLFWLALPLAVLFFWRDRLPKRLLYAGLGGIAAALLVCWALRLADPADTVAVFAPQQGAVYRLCSALIALLRAAWG